MLKFIALYKQPADEAAFLKHYAEVHTPLVLKTPGLSRLEVTRLTRNPMGGEAAYFLMAEMYYPDLDTYKAAMKSPENAAAGKDLMGFAGDLVTLLQGEVQQGQADAVTQGRPPQRPDHVPDPTEIMERQREMDEEGKTASGAYEIMNDKK